MSDINHEAICEDSGTTRPVEYMISSKEGTELETFRNLIRDLPDCGKGYLMVFFGNQQTQSYITSLTYHRAKEVAKSPFVDSVTLSGEIETDPIISQAEHEPCCEDSGTEEPTKYMIDMKEGTRLSTFKRFIMTLQDKGQGYQMISRDLENQSYITTITYEKAKEIAKKPFVDYVIMAGAVEKTDRCVFGAQPPQHNINSAITPQQGLRVGLTHDQHLRILSSPPQERQVRPWADYTYDPALGRDQTVYILDSGFNIYHPELSGQGRSRWATYVVSHQLTLADVHPDFWPPGNDVRDWNGHGTMVASLAVGKEHGVASNANFVLIKLEQIFYNPDKKSYEYATITRSSVNDAWQHVIDDVLNRRENGDTGKSVVIMAYGFQCRPPWQDHHRFYFDRMFRKILEKCWLNDIITVIPAGNKGEDYGLTIDKFTPQNLGRPDNPLITVGGVDQAGFYWPPSSFSIGRGGHVTVYAVAKDVSGASSLDPNVPAVKSGTSWAAPVVAGLAAYFASLTSLDGEWRQGRVAMDMKEYIKKHSFQRRDPPFSGERLPDTYAIFPLAHIGFVNVASNRAHEGLCSAQKPPGDPPAPPPIPNNSGNANRGGHSGNIGGAHRGRGRGCGHGRGHGHPTASSSRGGGRR